MSSARTNLLKILGRNMLFRSLMTSHNPDLEIYNADAAHCLPAVFTEMLVDSRPGIVEVLPALPPEWPNGSLRGIRTRAGVRIDELRWDLGEGVARVTLTAPDELDVVVVCRSAVDPRRSVRLAPRTAVTVTIPLA
ncbi:glycoside hydrolase family 95-like protein [Streptomyces sp. L7]